MFLQTGREFYSPPKYSVCLILIMAWTGFTKKSVTLNYLRSVNTTFTRAAVTTLFSCNKQRREGMGSIELLIMLFNTKWQNKLCIMIVWIHILIFVVGSRYVTVHCNFILSMCVKICSLLRSEERPRSIQNANPKIYTYVHAWCISL